MAMGEVIKRLSASLSLDTGDFQRGSREAQGEMERLSKRMAAIGATLGVSVVAAFGAVAKAGLEGAIAQRQAVAQVEAALASMGNAAGRTAEQLVATADAQELRSLFDADVILKQVTANLLTFGNIAGEQFDRAQQAALDMATRLGGEPQAAAIMLGKALNDPIAGINALTRVGIKFTDAQKLQIKAMAEAGSVAAAQGVILAEVERQVRGAAQAAADASPYRAFQVTMGQIADTVGEALLPVIISMRDWLIRNQAAILEAARGAVELGGTIVRLVQQFSPLIAGVAAYRLALVAANIAQGAYVASMIMATRAIGAARLGTLALNAALISNPFGAVAVAVGTLVGAFVSLRNSQAEARAETDNLIRSLKGLAQARSADFALKRTEASTEVNSLTAQIAENRRTIANYRKELTASRAGEVRRLEEENFNLERRQARLSFELLQADKAFYAAGRAAEAMQAPVAQLSPALRDVGGNAGAASGALGGLSQQSQETGRQLELLMDRLFPAVAEARKLREEMALIDGSNLPDDQKAEARFRLGTEKLGDAAVSKDLLETAPLVDFGKQFEDLQSVLGKAANDTETKTVQIAESFRDMAQNSIRAIEGLTGAIKGGGFLDILGSVVNLFLQLGSTGLFGKGLATNINAPRIPGNAQGTHNWRGGLTWVGERGPELAHIPRGGQVISNRDLKAANSNGGRVTNYYYTLPSTEFWGQVDGIATQRAAQGAQAGAAMAQGQMAQRAQRRVR